MSREITKAQRRWLEGELVVWQRMGLIAADQTQTLLGLYESPETTAARQQSKGILTLLALAALFVGFAVLLLIGYNWEEMAPPFKVAAIFSTLIGTHAIGGLLRYQVGWRRLSEVAFFLGCLFFGAAIFLLAQIFNISSDNYDALWWWAVCTLPFALLFETALLHLLFAALLAGWVGFEVLSLDRLLFWGVHSAGYSVPFLIAPGLWWAYRKNSATVVGIYLPVLVWWVILQPFAWKLHADPTFFVGAIGSLLLLVAAMHPARSEMALPFRFYGAGMVAGTLVPLSFHGWYRWMDFYAIDPTYNGVVQMIVILILAALTFVAAFFLQKNSLAIAADPQQPPVRSILEILKRQSIPCALLAFFVFLAVWVPIMEDSWVPTIAANVAMIALAFWLIRLGLTEDRGRPFGAGVAYLLFWAVLRYIDLFGAFGGMLGAALIFFLCGAALFGVALYWRNRKAVSLV